MDKQTNGSPTLLDTTLWETVGGGGVVPSLAQQNITNPGYPPPPPK